MADMTLGELVQVVESFTLSGVPLSTPVRLTDGLGGKYEMERPPQDPARFTGTEITFGEGEELP